MKEINGEKFISEEDLKSKIAEFLVKDETMMKAPAMISLLTGANIFAFIKFVFKEGDEDENNGKMS